MKRDPSPLDKAYDTAIRDLRNCYGSLGIYAGSYRHREYWGRDFFISSYGACILKNFGIVRKGIELFISNMREDGHVPLRIEGKSHAWGSLGITRRHKKLKVFHRSVQPWASGDVVDSNPWLIIAVGNYLDVSKDVSWVDKSKPALIKIGSWLENQIGKNGLIHEGRIANWSDCNLRHGNIFYTNVLTWKSFGVLSKIIGGVRGKEYKRKSMVLKKNVLSSFWSVEKGYFIDRLHTSGNPYKYFYSDGNILAVLWGLARKDMAERIFDYIDTNKLPKVPVPAGHPGLDRLNNLFNSLFFPMYKTRYSFPFLGGFLACARLEFGDKDSALKDLENVARIINNHGHCPEVVKPNGNEYKTWFYQSEKGIAWTASMYIYAYDKLRGLGES